MSVPSGLNPPPRPGEAGGRRRRVLGGRAPGGEGSVRSHPSSLVPRPSSRVSILDLAGEYRSLQSRLDAAVLEVLRSGAYIGGPVVAGLEERVARLCGARFGVGVASGTDALLLPLVALGLRPGDEVITTPFTFFAPSEVLLLRGARPVFVDIDPATFNLDPDAVAAAITPRTVGILPVHLFGGPADMTALTAIAARHSLWVLEDAAQAIGASHALAGGERGQPVGSWGIAAGISFYPTKNLGAAGDGGMVVTNDEALAARLRLLRNHGNPGDYSYQTLGFNSRLDALQAAILSVKLDSLEEWTEARRHNARAYNERLAGLPLVLPDERSGDRHVYHQYTLRSAHRDALARWLDACGIDTRVYYPAPLHTQPACASLGYRAGQFPEAERACREVLSLPVHPQLSEAQLDRVVQALEQFFRERRVKG
jgi:dTDP-4-amino-4,6-dideoxygalactose transaminase